MKRTQAVQVRVAEVVAADAQPSAGWRFTPQVIVFFSSACVMVLELVAGRLTARHLGSSLYTWTSIIGVVLAAPGKTPALPLAPVEGGAVELVAEGHRPARTGRRSRDLKPSRQEKDSP